MKCSQTPKEHGYRCSYGGCDAKAEYHVHWGTGCGHLCLAHLHTMERSAKRQGRTLEVKRFQA